VHKIADSVIDQEYITIKDECPYIITQCFAYSARKREKQRPIARPRSRQEDYIIMDRKEIEWEGVKWIYLAQEDEWRALANA
jgi:hypothetical protein